MLPGRAIVALHLIATIPLYGSAANPFQRGCLHAKNLTSKIRVCGSEDSATAASNGLCRPPPMDYAEIRLLPGDWESTFFETWILQIALSELLNVPTSVETGDAYTKLDFYNPDSPLDFSVSHDYKRSLENALLLGGDCQKADRGNNTYQTCGHFNPEAWSAHKPDVQDMVSRGVIETPQSLGLIAQEGWFIPKFTAERDPSLLSHFGLQGEENRRKLAERFLRPTTWGDYCLQVSSTNCTIPDDVAQRPPFQHEVDMMFSENQYTGHFQATKDNNCTANPSCTGHISDYPCTWASPVPSQLHYLGIALDPELESGGYDYLRLTQIWKAANATKSDVIFYWWRQDHLFDEFFGTEAEFIPVTMPTATQECMDSRPTASQHCSLDINDRVGEPAAVCGEPPRTLHGVLSTTVYDQAYSGSPDAVHSPSHSALANFQLSQLQLDEIFALSNSMTDPREALCEWVSNNMEYMEGLVPRTYPRALKEKDEKSPLLYASTVVGALVVLIVLVTIFKVHQQQNLRALQYAQIEFLDLLLMGSLLIAIGSVVMGAPTTDASCVASIWLVNIGYTLELVPLIVKVGAVLHVMQLGKRMQRIKIKRHMLFGVVALICLLMVVYLLSWSVLDAPQATLEYELSGHLNREGETTVWVLNVCSSGSQVWSYLSVGWNGCLLLVTTVLAVKMRNIPAKGFNETPTLALLVYSHMFFLVMRVIAHMLSSNVSEYVLARCLSLMFSADTLATIVIYFLPKFMTNDDDMGGTIRISMAPSSNNASTDWYTTRLSAGNSKPMLFGEANSDLNLSGMHTQQPASETICRPEHPTSRSLSTAVIKPFDGPVAEDNGDTTILDIEVQQPRDSGQAQEELQRRPCPWLLAPNMDVDDDDDDDETTCPQPEASISLLLLQENKRLKNLVASLQEDKEGQWYRIFDLESRIASLRKQALLAAAAAQSLQVDNSDTEVMPKAA